jgi:hypothetical protein
MNNATAHREGMRNYMQERKEKGNMPIIENFHRRSQKLPCRCDGGIMTTKEKNPNVDSSKLSIVTN